MIVSKKSKRNNVIVVIILSILIVIILCFVWFMSTHTIIDNKIYDIKTEELDLSFRKLSDEDIDRLKRFKYIKKLDMSYCEIESLEFIKDMPYLYSITMCGKGFSEVDLSPIRECSGLKKYQYVIWN